MKNFMLVALLCGILQWANAQRVAYVDMNKVLESVPEYNNAQKELEELSERWRQEMAKEYDKIDQMYKEYQAREPLMGDEARKQKQDEIMNKEKELRDLQKKRFGPEGELFQRRQTLVKPVQERVYKTIEKYAQDLNYEFVFTAPDGATIIYAKSDKDITNEVIKRLKSN
jgi:outer membrane protein